MAMTRKTSSDSVRQRIRAEIVEATQGLHRIGAVSDEELRQTTLRMLGREALPKVEPMTPADIVAVRKKAGVSQAVLAGYLNVAINTVSQWERGERKPTGAALKLLNVVKRSGIEVLG